MSTLAERLAARPPRRVSVPIEVSDPGDDVRAAAMSARLALQQVRSLKAVSPDIVTDDVLAEAERESAAASAALGEHVEYVELQAAPSDEWERLIAEHLSDNGDDVDDGALPHLLAACAVDESLRTPEAWVTVLHGLAWGDRDSLHRAVIDVNTWTPSRGLGKD